MYLKLNARNGKEKGWTRNWIWIRIQISDWNRIRIIKIRI